MEPCARPDDVLPTSPDGASRGLGRLGKLHFIKVRGFCAFPGHMGHMGPCPVWSRDAETSIPSKEP